MNTQILPNHNRWALALIAVSLWVLGATNAVRKIDGPCTKFLEDPVALSFGVLAPPDLFIDDLDDFHHFMNTALENSIPTGEGDGVSELIYFKGPRKERAVSVTFVQESPTAVKVIGFRSWNDSEAQELYFRYVAHHGITRQIYAYPPGEPGLKCGDEFKTSVRISPVKLAKIKLKHGLDLDMIDRILGATHFTTARRGQFRARTEVDGRFYRVIFAPNDHGEILLRTMYAMPVSDQDAEP